MNDLYRFITIQEDGPTSPRGKQCMVLIKILKTNH